MARDALHMRLGWSAAPRFAAAAPAGIRVRELSRADGAELGRLMWAAFRGTVDDTYSAPPDADAEAAATLDGTWGPVLWHASLAAEAGFAMVAAVVVVRDRAHDGTPLLAFAVTDPASQGRGIGRRLIEESIGRLAASGVRELHLAVARGNRAYRLYQRLGFQVVPPDQAT